MASMSHKHTILIVYFTILSGTNTFFQWLDFQNSERRLMCIACLCRTEETPLQKDVILPLVNLLSWGEMACLWHPIRPKRDNWWWFVMRESHCARYVTILRKMDFPWDINSSSDQSEKPIYPSVLYTAWGEKPGGFYRGVYMILSSKHRMKGKEL